MVYREDRGCPLIPNDTGPDQLVTLRAGINLQTDMDEKKDTKKYLVAVRIRAAKNGFVVSCEYETKRKIGPMQCGGYDSHETIFKTAEEASAFVAKEIKAIDV